ncbi:hypothetical protein B0H17DRAFT_224015 [Mycena rosella]|uniref:Uncharacterized protein n=1 Tax=Mycena rosella TaxID=1033263 RepID=A0AAD7CXF9_MYCRO|nr:hypothetical protein B0H17DRAFT_224015 [Mycena rosella]
MRRPEPRSCRVLKNCSPFLERRKILQLLPSDPHKWPFLDRISPENYTPEPFHIPESAFEAPPETKTSTDSVMRSSKALQLGIVIVGALSRSMRGKTERIWRRTILMSRWGGQGPGG